MHGLKNTVHVCYIAKQSVFLCVIMWVCRMNLHSLQMKSLYQASKWWRLETMIHVIHVVALWLVNSQFQQHVVLYFTLSLSVFVNILNNRDKCVNSRDITWQRRHHLGTQRQAGVGVGGRSPLSYWEGLGGLSQEKF